MGKEENPTTTRNEEKVENELNRGIGSVYEKTTNLRHVTAEIIIKVFFIMEKCY